MLDWIRRRGRAAGTTMEGLFETLEEGGFTEGSLRAVALAREESRRFGHSYVGTEHVLLGLLREDGGMAATVLRESGVDPDGVRASVEGIVGRAAGDAGPFEEPVTPRARRVLRLAREEALRLDYGRVGPEHLLLGLIRDAEEGEGLGVSARVLEDLGVDRLGVRRRVQREIGIEG